MNCPPYEIIHQETKTQSLKKYFIKKWDKKKGPPTGMRQMLILRIAVLPKSIARICKRETYEGHEGTKEEWYPKKLFLSL